MFTSSPIISILGIVAWLCCPKHSIRYLVNYIKVVFNLYSKFLVIIFAFQLVNLVGTWAIIYILANGERDVSSRHLHKQ